MRKYGILVTFDVSSSSYDPELVMRTLEEFAYKQRVWNFVPGSFALSSDTPLNRVRDRLRETFDKFFLVEFDPSSIDGSLPNAAWESFLLRIFPDWIGEVADRQHVSVEVIIDRAKLARTKSQIEHETKKN